MRRKPETQPGPCSECETPGAQRGRMPKAEGQPRAPAGPSISSTQSSRAEDAGKHTLSQRCQVGHDDWGQLPPPPIPSSRCSTIHVSINCVGRSSFHKMTKECLQNETKFCTSISPDFTWYTVFGSLCSSCFRACLSKI